MISIVSICSRTRGSKLGSMKGVCRLWEAEALQMEAVTLVLIASLVAHLYFWPYQAAWLNHAQLEAPFQVFTWALCEAPF